MSEMTGMHEMGYVHTLTCFDILSFAYGTSGEVVTQVSGLVRTVLGRRVPREGSSQPLCAASCPPRRFQHHQTTYRPPWLQERDSEKEGAEGKGGKRQGAGVEEPAQVDEGVKRGECEKIKEDGVMGTSSQHPPTTRGRTLREKTVEDFREWGGRPDGVVWGAEGGRRRGQSKRADEIYAPLPIRSPRPPCSPPQARSRNALQILAIGIRT